MGTLRFLLAIVVVISHCIVFGNCSVFGITTPSGYLAIRSFFIISGFYMWMILNEKYVGENKSYSLFITNRFLRFYPVYWLVLIATVAFAGLEMIFFKNTPNQLAPFIAYAPLLRPASIGILIFSNLFIFGQGVLSFLGLNVHTGGFMFNTLGGVQNDFMFLPQSWTLSVELCCYLFVPFLATRNIMLSIGIIIICIAAEFIMYLHGYNNAAWSYRFFPFEFAVFLVGGICYKIYSVIKERAISKQLLTTIWLVLLLITIYYQYFPGDELKKLVFCAVLVAAMPFTFHLTKNYKWDRYLGELSYPLFIVHVLVVSVLKCVGISSSYFGVAAIISSTVLAIVIYHFITVPIEKVRQKRLNKSNSQSIPVS